MRRASYRFAVHWIAENDNSAEDDDASKTACYMTVHLVADMFGLDDDRVARDVVRVRRDWTKGVA